jgi:hypothetical protein
MSRYLLLLLLNLPFVMMAILSAITQYKLKRISRKKMSIRVILWLIVIIGLALAQPLYEWLLSRNLTDTEPLSLFDVIQITAIVVLFYITNRLRAKVEVLEKRTQDLHQEISIRLSSIEPKK